MRAKPWDVPDGLWERIEPLLPKQQRRFRYPGHRDRLGASAAGARVRLRDDRVAEVADVAAGGCVGQVARGVARGVACRRSA